MGQFLAAVLIVVASLVLGRSNAWARPAAACTTGITLTLHPGLPPLANRVPHMIARDIPRGPFKVSLPIFPGPKPLRNFVADPLTGYPDDPYLQTAAAEYQGTGDPVAVMRWARKAYSACGWRWDGTTNAGTGMQGLDFVAAKNPRLEAEVSSAGFYIAYAALELTYPPRPASSYLRGRFREVRIALQVNDYGRSSVRHHVVYKTVTNKEAIVSLVQAINALDVPWTNRFARTGGGGNGPAWLSFVRPDGRQVHAYELGGAELSVNGSRPLADDGRVWREITALVGLAK